MPKVSSYTQTQIKLLYKQGLHPAEIFKLLKGEGLLVSFASVTWIVKKLQLTGSVANLPRSGRPRKLYVEVNAFIDQQMRSNDDMVGRLSLHLGQVAHQARAYPSFCSMKRLRVFLLPPGWDASPLQGYPPALNSPVPIYAPGWRDTVRVKCLAQDHITSTYMFYVFLFYLGWVLYSFLHIWN